MSSPDNSAAGNLVRVYKCARTHTLLRRKGLTTIKLSKKRRCSLLKAKIIQLVMKVCSVVNDWIRKSTVSPNQALLIAQRKDNQTQTNAPPPPPAAACILKHSVTSKREQTGRGKKNPTSAHSPSTVR